jgi:hypothetical protein
MGGVVESLKPGASTKLQWARKTMTAIQDFRGAKIPRYRARISLGSDGCTLVDARLGG